MVVDQFHIAARRDHRFDGFYGLIRIIGRDDPQLECAASSGYRPGRLYPNEECFRHVPNMARSPASANPASGSPDCNTLKLTHYRVVGSTVPFPSVGIPRRLTRIRGPSSSGTGTPIQASSSDKAPGLRSSRSSPRPLESTENLQPAVSV